MAVYRAVGRLLAWRRLHLKASDI